MPKLLPTCFRLRPSGLQTSPHTSQQLTPTVTLTTPPGQSLQRDRANAALRLAIQRHLDKLPDPEKEAFREAAKTINEDNLLSKARECDDAHKHMSSFRPQAERLRKPLNLLDRFMGGVAIGIQAHPEISSLVAGGVRIIIDLAISFAELFSRLADMLCQFEAEFGLIKTNMQHYLDVLRLASQALQLRNDLETMQERQRKLSQPNRIFCQNDLSVGKSVAPKERPLFQIFWHRGYMT